MTTAEAASAPGLVRMMPSRIWLCIGLAALVLPTMVRVAQEHWTSDDGAHGPILLATALWLLWRARATIEAHRRPVHSWGWTLLLLPLLLLHAFASAYDVLFVQTATLYATLIVLAVLYWGTAVLRRLWFPVLYFAFLIVPPGTVVAEATLPLKLWISNAAVDLLHLFGYPVAQSGAAIHIDQYELLVERACAGLGSLLSLTALGLLYVHLRRDAGVVRALILAALIIPVAILANFIRVVMLVLMTYHVGNDFAQGVAHDAAGLVMFFIAMLCMLALDRILEAFTPRRNAAS